MIHIIKICYEKFKKKHGTCKKIKAVNKINGYSTNFKNPISDFWSLVKKSVKFVICYGRYLWTISSKSYTFTRQSIGNSEEWGNIYVA